MNGIWTREEASDTLKSFALNALQYCIMEWYTAATEVASSCLCLWMDKQRISKEKQVLFSSKVLNFLESIRQSDGELMLAQSVKGSRELMGSSMEYRLTIDCLLTWDGDDMEKLRYQWDLSRLDRMKDRFIAASELEKEACKIEYSSPR